MLYETKAFSVPYWNLSERIMCFLHAYCFSYIPALINNVTFMFERIVRILKIVQSEL